MEIKTNVLDDEKGNLKPESELLIAERACDLVTLLVDDGVSI